MESSNGPSGLKIPKPPDPIEALFQQRVLERARLLFVPKEDGGHGYSFVEFAPGWFYVHSESQKVASFDGYVVDMKEQSCECECFIHHGCCKHQLGLFLTLAEKGHGL